MIKTKIIALNEHYIVIVYNDSNIDMRHYSLYDKNDCLKCDSFNRDSFLIKANKFEKISNELKCFIASI